MPDNKKYYYLKLKDNFYDSDELKILESMKDGYLYSNILLKLYLRSLKNNGELVLNNCIPYSVEMLSSIVNHPVGVVKQALTIFKQMNMIEVLDNGTIFMNDIQNFIGESSTEADRIRSYRNRINIEKEKLLTSNERNIVTNVQQMNDERTPEIEIEKDIERRDKDRDKDKKKTFEPESIIKEFSANDEELESSLLEWYSYRKGKSFTEHALRLNLNKLRKLSGGIIPVMKEIVAETVMNGWKSFFPLKNRNPDRQRIDTVNNLMEKYKQEEGNE